MDKLSGKLESMLKEVEKEISKFLDDHAFYLEFKNKSWAACPSGQTLLALTTLAINLKYNIETMKKHGL